LNQFINEFNQKILTDNIVLPYFLISEYQAMDINEKQLVVLLRILHPYFKNGELNIQSIAKEFSVSEEEAKIKVQPYFDKELLVENTTKNSIEITGIMKCYFEHWMATQRNNKRRPTAKKVACSNSKTEQKLIKQKTHLYHIFEQELGRNLSPLQSEEMSYWLEKDNIPPELIEEALKRAVMQEKRTFAYIKSILKKWRDAGYNDLATVIANDNKPRTKKRNTKQEDNKNHYYNRIYDKY
jgi:DNA replication protein